ncbi:Heterogeneous nuclear ribonucleoprotein Q [Linum perenne]
MTEGTEVDERVDFEEDNYMEDEDVEEQPDDGEDDRANNRNLHGEDDEDDDDSNPKEEEEEEHSPQDDVDEEIDVEAEPVEEDEEKPADSFNDEEREKRAQLLALPPHGSEVFIGGLPKDVVEDDLNELCEAFGEIFEIRLVKDKDTGESKGFAFVSFKSKEVAQKAIDELHNKQFRGKTLRCSLSETKNRLFVGNIPKNLTEDQFRTVIEEVGPGAEVIELIKDPLNPSRNRGFAFILYYNNACADYSRQKMLNSSFKLDGNTPTISWADPKASPDHSAAASQVKALYVKNIPENTTTERLKELFIRHGEVTKVVMPPGKAGKRDFGFIHFAERSSALKAVKDTEKYEIDGQSLEVVLAKPQADKRSDGAYLYGAGMPPAHVATPSYGAFAANPYGSMGGGFGAASGFQQPMIYGRGPMPSGMQMVPMVLPDGRVGYVLQQPGMQLPHSRPPRRGDRGNGMSGSGRGGGSNSDDGNRGRRYRPY